MYEIKETKKLYRELSEKYILLMQGHANSVKVKNLELELLECEVKLRSLGVDF